MKKILDIFILAIIAFLVPIMLAVIIPKINIATKLFILFVLLITIELPTYIINRRMQEKLKIDNDEFSKLFYLKFLATSLIKTVYITVWFSLLTFMLNIVPTAEIYFLLIIAILLIIIFTVKTTVEYINFKNN